jgi:hypothetical protein
MFGYRLIKISILLRAEIDEEKYGTNIGDEKLYLISRLLRRLQRSQDSVVGIANGYGLDNQGVRIRVQVVQEFSPRRPDRLWGPLSLLSNGYRGIFPPRVKRQGREADQSPQTSAEVKKMWIYTSTPPYAFMASA